jgi:hypothetical protein
MKNTKFNFLMTSGIFYLIFCLLLNLICTTHDLQAQNPVKEKQNLNVGKKFPEVKDDSLEKTPVSLPDAARGKVALITVAFLRASQSQLDSWLEPFVEKYGNKSGFTFYEVPMLAGAYRLMRLIIDGGMRAGIPKEKHKNVVTMYGDVQKYIKALNLDTRYGYAFLLDREGIIRWEGQGFSTPEKLKELFETAERLAK